MITGKHALVTGGGTGVGRAIALALAETGVAVTICGRRKEQLARGNQEHFAFRLLKDFVVHKKHLEPCCVDRRGHAHKEIDSGSDLERH